MIRLKKALGALVAVLAVMMVVAAAGCTPEEDLNYGPLGDRNLPPADALSAKILKRFTGRDFLLGHNDQIAQVSSRGGPPAEALKVEIPFWLGVNPMAPFYKRPILGRIYVISESTAVRPLSGNDYLIRAGSLMFQGDTVFEARYVKYAGMGKMLPFIVRFVGTRIITVPRDPPATGTITEKVLVLREVSLPMYTPKPLKGYAKCKILATLAPQPAATPTPAETKK